MDNVADREQGFDVYLKLKKAFVYVNDVVKKLSRLHKLSDKDINEYVNDIDVMVRQLDKLLSEVGKSFFMQAHKKDILNRVKSFKLSKDGMIFDIDRMCIVVNSDGGVSSIELHEIFLKSYYGEDGTSIWDTDTRENIINHILHSVSSLMMSYKIHINMYSLVLMDIKHGNGGKFYEK